MNTSQPPRPRWLRFILAAAVTAAIGGSWALATPLMGVPDEPPHVIRAAAVVRGVETVEHGQQPTVEVPAFIARSYSLACFAYDSRVPASCQRPAVGDPERTIDAVTTADSNSPVYYALVGLPSLVLHDDSAFYGMRAVNVLLIAVMIGLAAVALGDLTRRRWTTVGLAVALTPQFFFLTGAVNPNALEPAAGAALLLTLIAALRSPGDRRRAIERCGAVVASASLLISTRSISLAWLAIIVVVALLLARPARLRAVLKNPVYLTAVGLVALVGAATVLWYATAQRVGSDPGNFGAGHSFLYGALIMLQRTFDYLDGWIGLFGWLDTAAPALTYAVWTSVTLAMLVVPLLIGRGRPRIAAALAVAAVIIVPPLVQGSLVTAIGIIWQGRYNLALFAIALVLCGLVLDTRLRSTPVSDRIRSAVVVALAAAQFAAFVWSLRRFSVGESKLPSALLTDPAWQPPLGVLPVILLGALSCAAGAVLLLRADRRPAPAPAPALSRAAG